MNSKFHSTLIPLVIRIVHGVYFIASNNLQHTYSLYIKHIVIKSTSQFLQCNYQKLLHLSQFCPILCPSLHTFIYKIFLSIYQLTNFILCTSYISNYSN